MSADTCPIRFVCMRLARFQHSRTLTRESRVCLETDEALGSSSSERLDRGLRFLDAATPSQLALVSHATYASLLRDCGSLKAIEQGKRLHAHIAAAKFDAHTFVGNMLVNMYGSCGSMREATAAFGAIAQRNVFTWNMLLGANAQNGHFSEAEQVFSKMPHWNAISWNSAIAACTKQGRMQRAWELFHSAPERNVSSWNTLVAANAQNGHLQEALVLCRKMALHGENPDEVTFISVLDACCKPDEGTRVHELALELGLEQGIKVTNALISMYGRQGRLQQAEQVFRGSKNRSVVTWSALVAALAQNGHCKEALQLFLEMDLEGMRPNAVTFVTVLDACASISLEHGRAIHESIGGDMPLILGNALVNMYGKCACVEQAKLVFDAMVEKDVISWSAMVAAYSHNGHDCQALATFRSMEQAGLKPNGVSFTSVLASCSHAGFLEDGCYYYASATRDYHLHVNLDHCRIMVDLLGRAGKLQEAEVFVHSVMPVQFQGDQVVWTTFLSNCRLHNDHERGRRAARRATTESSSYVMLSSLVPHA